MDKETENNHEKPPKKIILGTIKEQAGAGSIQKFTQFASDLARRQGYSEERIVEIENTFKEALTNIVNYAFREVSGDIEILCSLDRAERIVFKIIDWGKPFNMLLASDPLFKEEFAEEGIPQPSARLIKKLADTTEYQHMEDMNRLLLTFSKVLRGGK